MIDLVSNRSHTTGSASAPILAIVSLGEMGAWIAHKLISHGGRVRAKTHGRSAASIGRASALGVIECEDDISLLEGADFLLSVVPPASAYPVAQQLCRALRQVRRKPVYIDFNAISDKSVMEIAALVRAAGAECVDGSIIGAASGKVGVGPRFYVSGPQHPAAMSLARYGLDMRSLGDQIGRASALKCCFAGLNKGLTALALQTVLASRQAGVDATLVLELKESAPQLAGLLERLLPEVSTKARRWVGEMKEVARQYCEVPGGHHTHSGLAVLFEAVLGEGGSRSQQIVEALDRFASALTETEPTVRQSAGATGPLSEILDQAR